jgi:hypothetical protein
MGRIYLSANWDAMAALSALAACGNGLPSAPPDASANAPSGQSSEAGSGSTGDAPTASESGSPSESGSSSPSSSAVVWTNRYDVGRTGAQTQEEHLTPASVTGGKFGLLFSRFVDGTIQAQPLIGHAIVIGGRAHDSVVFVVTESNTAYAFDALDPTESAPLWQAKLGPPVSSHWSCADLVPQSGVSATPVLDTATGSIYIVSNESAAGDVHDHHELHALDWATGLERPGSPVEIVPAGAGWNPDNHFSRVGLLLDAATLYVAFGSHCDDFTYYGWIVAYDAPSLSRKGTYRTGESGGIWQSGMGLSADGNGGIFFVAGVSNHPGTLPCTASNLCQSVGKVTLGGGGLTLSDWYQPSNAAASAAADLDLTTAFILPKGSPFGFASGKDGVVHVLDRSRLGNIGGAVQTVDVFTPFVPGSAHGGGAAAGHVHGGPVYWDGSKGPMLFVWPEAAPLQAYAVTASGLSAQPAALNTAAKTNHPGPITTVSSNGKMPGTGILWASMMTNPAADAWHSIVAGTLDAFDAEDVSRHLWSSDVRASDQLGLFAKFCPPTVANGMVYVGTAAPTNALRVYGLHP